MKTLQKIMLFAVCLLAVGAFAQQNPPAQGGGDGQGHGPRRGMQSVDDQLKTLTDRLNLTSDQQAQIKPILEDTHAQMAKIMQDDSASREDKMAKVRSLHETASGKVRDILTDDQKKKFDGMQKEMQDRMRQRQQGGDAASKDNSPK
ncbi:MAG TPA: hypothetical protein VFB79_21715 [Candidatus Angelobacter sp.]|nr:hypothetical protein [Candidatus Angelobacter sp.]